MAFICADREEPEDGGWDCFLSIVFQSRKPLRIRLMKFETDVECGQFAGVLMQSLKDVNLKEYELDDLVLEFVTNDGPGCPDISFTFSHTNFESTYDPADWRIADPQELLIHLQHAFGKEAIISNIQEPTRH